MQQDLQAAVRRRARFCCEYCGMPEEFASTPFQIDHITARSHSGETAVENLALACFHCNSFKGPNIAGIDPQTGQVIRLYSPRIDRYRDHFTLRDEWIIGRTPIGRATIQVLRLNHPSRLEVRRWLLKEGIPLAPDGGGDPVSG